MQCWVTNKVAWINQNFGEKGGGGDDIEMQCKYVRT